jgi:hypothetical protein
MYVVTEFGRDGIRVWMPVLRDRDLAVVLGVARGLATKSRAKTRVSKVETGEVLWESAGAAELRAGPMVNRRVDRIISEYLADRSGEA